MRLSLLTFPESCSVPAITGKRPLQKSTNELSDVRIAPVNLAAVPVILCCLCFAHRTEDAIPLEPWALPFVHHGKCLHGGGGSLEYSSLLAAGAVGWWELEGVQGGGFCH